CATEGGGNYYVLSFAYW
nr:immunoglobulin heavy chain junction region [Macaca mulatta]MOV86661.1 immunoglobulin heavy chain junction region [Macaca mulatta]MOV87194.1 immunoglobulin heavy chain junction region [Macaca mulatta]MOV87480.1 immunoglobulin heavy chain junction region [Macaca mulatta]MOV87812.1 immunoglobulin heavy chain junction region [Macaca mulatta]